MKLFKRVLSLTTVFCLLFTSVAGAFSDLSSNHWAYNVINEMVDKGCLSGYPDGTFKPQKEVTRAEFATILVRTLKIEENNEIVDFKDIEGIHWAEEYIDFASPFLTGYISNGEYYFKPDEPALREDAAVAIVRAKGLTSENVDTNILNKFSDKNSISENAEQSGFYFGLLVFLQNTVFILYVRRSEEKSPFVSSVYSFFCDVSDTVLYQDSQNESCRSNTGTDGHGEMVWLYERLVLPI